MTLLDDSSLPTDAEATRAWLTAVEESIAAMTRVALRRIMRDAWLAYAATLTAAGDPGALDSIPKAWMTFVTDDLNPKLAATHLSGSMTAWVGLKTAPTQAFANSWTAVVNESAVSYMGQATNRLARVGDEAWRHVRTIATNGVRDGLTNEEIKGKIQDVTRFSEFRADTIARTEAVGAYVNGNMAGARALGADGPAEKVWRAANDARTRPSHQQADNQARKLADPFDVGGVSMDAPHEPGAPAGEVVNCRCYVEMLYPGDTRPDGTTVDEDTAKPPPPAKVEPGPPAKKAPAKKAPAKVPPREDFKGWVDHQKQGILRTKTGKYKDVISKPALARSEVRVREIGQRVHEEVDRAITQRLGAESPAGLQAKYTRLIDANAKEFARVADVWAKDSGFDDWMDWWDAVQRKDPKLSKASKGLANSWSSKHTKPDLEWLRHQFQAADVRYYQTSKDLENFAGEGFNRRLREAKAVYAEEYGPEAQRQLARLRPMGGAEFVQGGDPYAYGIPRQTAQATIKSTVDRGIQRFPEDWNRAVGWDEARVFVGNLDDSYRSYATRYDPNQGRAIHLARPRDFPTAVHEMAHQVENSIEPIRWHENQFVLRRAAESGETKPSLLSVLVPGANYGPSEVAFGDKFGSKYIGKVYGGQTANGEVLSMGVGQGLVGGERWFLDDADLRNFILGLLAGL